MTLSESSRTDPSAWTLLFVDDERPVLDGLRRMLRPTRHSWDMEFCCDPRAAARLVEQGGIDALVTDMRMPAMDGVQLLREARACSPGTLRIVLSGHADRNAAISSIGLAHQFLAKPCEPAMLMSVLRRSRQACRGLADPGLAHALAALPALAGQQDSVRAVTIDAGDELQSLRSLSRAVEIDVAMTLRVLQLVSSSFFGLGRTAASVAEAVSSLGSDVMSALAQAPDALASNAPPGCEPEVMAISRHASRVSRLAARIAALRGCDASAQSAARLGGMLHDAGRVALLSVAPQRQREVPDTHAGHVQVAASLMALWGLPDTIVDAVAFQSGPWDPDSSTFVPAAAVQLADVLVHELDGEPACRPDPDEEGLFGLGLHERRQQWLDEAAGLLGEAWRDAGCRAMDSGT
jgi:response regulator RpfG family c-di-GMP phosphodiesterase